MRVTFQANDFTDLPEEWINSMPKWGACDTAISEIMMHNTVLCDRDVAINYLTHIGYDEPERLEEKSDETLTSVILWIALLDCRDNETTQFYMVG